MCCHAGGVTGRCKGNVSCQHWLGQKDLGEQNSAESNSLSQSFPSWEGPWEAVMCGWKVVACLSDSGSLVACVVCLPAAASVLTLSPGPTSALCWMCPLVLLSQTFSSMFFFLYYAFCALNKSPIEYRLIRWQYLVCQRWYGKLL